MTVLVGVLCQDGVVIGSDSSATFSIGDFRTIEQKVKKVEVVADDVILAGTGQVGLGQRFSAQVQSLRQTSPFPRSPHAIEVAKSVATETIKDFASTFCDKGQFGALMAFVTKEGFHLCEFQVKDFQPELKTKNLWYVSMGSGQPITDPFLGLMRRVFWKDNMPRLNQGVFAVTWALQHTIELNPGGINGPMQIGILDPSKSTKARLLTDDELSEHIDSVEGAERYLANYPSTIAGGSAQPVPKPPSA